MTFQEAQKGLCRKLDIDFDDIANNDLFSLEDIKDYVNQGAMKAWDYRSWDFAEESKAGTLTSTEVTAGYVAYPTVFVPSSIFLLHIAGKEYDKKNFQDFKRYFIDSPTGTDKIWTEYKRLIFFNKNITAIDDTIETWGKLNFTELSDDDDLMPFSPSTDAEQYSGNQAVVLLAYAEALSSDKKKNPTQAAIESGNAYRTLDILWKGFTDGRSIEQSSRPMFDAPDFFSRNNGTRGNNQGTFSSS